LSWRRFLAVNQHRAGRADLQKIGYIFAGLWRAGAMLRKIFVAASLGAMVVLGSASGSAQAGGNYYAGAYYGGGYSYGNAYPGYDYSGYAGYSYGGCCRGSFGRNTTYNPYYPPVQYAYPSPAPVAPPRVIYSAPVGPCVGQPATDAYGRPISVVKAGC
jgi:hypothetical protein